ncbi:VWA domain-containing protein [Knoellia sinensis]|nr:VWA domain-containing protein [Knoellia sinensis]
MDLLAPIWLLLLLPLGALAVTYVVLQRRRRRYAVRFASLPMLEKVAPHQPGWRRHAPAAAFVLALSALALAAARPVIDVRVPHERATVIVALDVSRSMQATDVEPTRMDAAKQAAASFIENLPDTFNVGLVTFSGSTSVVAPPTKDHEAVAAALDGLPMANSTAIGEAVFTSLDQVASMSGGDESVDVPARIVLLSDGTNTSGRSPDEAAVAASEAGVPVSTIAYGTQEGTVEIQGRLVPVPVDVEALAALADGTGGVAYTAESGDELAEVYEDIGSSIGWRTEAREITPYLAAAGFLLGLGAGAMSLRWFARLP